jgi:hypothetical protein
MAFQPPREGVQQQPSQKTCQIHFLIKGLSGEKPEMKMT